ncbi:hypothetical protein BB561_001141 [Smittium simulii]|uniref:Putative component of 'biosynthetic module' domain-containing protein n=1 Tax=Smittium simulii TaxID=133385 RepID=A0A2T9YW02_9FUNG|nr:hypothetical protein BB561_001141 [Smittium simulii]
MQDEYFLACSGRIKGSKTIPKQPDHDTKIHNATASKVANSKGFLQLKEILCNITLFFDQTCQEDIKRMYIIFLIEKIIKILSCDNISNDSTSNDSTSNPNQSNSLELMFNNNFTLNSKEFSSSQYPNLYALVIHLQYFLVDCIQKTNCVTIVSEKQTTTEQPNKEKLLTFMVIKSALNYIINLSETNDPKTSTPKHIFYRRMIAAVLSGLI